MTDIVETLRQWLDVMQPPPTGALSDDISEAAAEIERLRSAEVTPAMLEAALAVEPLTFADAKLAGVQQTEQLRAVNMRRVLTAALEARR